MSKDEIAVVVRVLVEMVKGMLDRGFTEPGGTEEEAGTIRLVDELLVSLTNEGLVQHLPLKYADCELARRMDEIYRTEYAQLMADRMETEQETMILQMEEDLGDDGDYYV